MTLLLTLSLTVNALVLSLVAVGLLWWLVNRVIVRAIRGMW